VPAQPVQRREILNDQTAAFDRSEQESSH
jgi:hypothetical protein